MKKAVLLATIGVCALFTVSILMAADGEVKPKAEVKVVKAEGDKPKVEGDKPKTEGDKPKPEGVKEGDAKKEVAKEPRLPEVVERISQAVGGLTDEQKQQIAALDKVRNEKIKEAMKQINDKFQADLSGVLTLDQQTKWDEAKRALENSKKEAKGDQPKGDAPKIEKPKGEGDPKVEKPKVESAPKTEKPKVEGDKPVKSPEVPETK